jgi:hypothetical protein
MKERPIIFSGDMVRVILDGRKTQTRRVIKPQPKIIHALYPDASIETERIFRRGDQRIHCPYGIPGDRLWVRETFCHATLTGYDARKDGGDYWYRATDEGLCDGPWKPSIFMPRWASRILLEITEVRVERVQDISEKDAGAEGAWRTPAGCSHYSIEPPEFETLWDSINAKRGYSWESNPWVWVISFRRIEG